jgi:hypothetical protein
MNIVKPASRHTALAGWQDIGCGIDLLLKIVHRRLVTVSSDGDCGHASRMTNAQGHEAPARIYLINLCHGRHLHRRLM